MSSFLTKFILPMISKIKPVLIKLVPIKTLRSLKEKLVLRSLKDVRAEDGHKFERAKNKDGINLIGAIRGEIGLGESCRRVARILKESGQPFTIHNYEQISSLRYSDHSWDDYITNTLPYNINLIHINPYELPLAYINLGKDSFKERYNIGYWLWELEEFPKSWIPSIDLVDEIWAPSEFATVALRKITDKPIHIIPYALEVPTSDEFNRVHFKLPEDKFLYLSMYDCNSTMERKNPMGAIHAYKLAFPEERADVGLVIKINNPQKQDLEIIQKELEAYTNVYIISEILTKLEVNSLIGDVDVFMSLHRAEGFGLPPAEAMWLGTAVIATNWSATTEFMTPETACLVDYELVVIEEDVGPYEAGNHWAEPDTIQASTYMLQLYQDASFYQSMVGKAKAHIHEVLSISQGKEKLNHRIAEIYQTVD